MDILKLKATLGFDSSEYDEGLNDAKSKAISAGGFIGNGLKTVAKVGAAAIGVATAAVGKFATDSIRAGGEFDKSMSQVAATMGMTIEQLNATEEEMANMSDAERQAAISAQENFGKLRDFAQEMGSTTAFSASEAADALNYMALAGYDAQTSMQMLPNVLNLAAAGDMELARASDMVTDAQSALGLQIEDMEGFVDQLAKTASKSNTSVEQLGDAILTIGGTAKILSGGTTELNTALGILADNGIKGAEGGTKLRNVLLSLSAPTDKASALLESLGVQAVDTATGDLRPLEDIMGDLSSSLDGLGSAEKAEIINTIFNKQDIAAVNALLDTSSNRWKELSADIEDSKGAAEAMAKTQLDNLAGDITMFQSALEGAKIAVSDGLTPSLRDFVKFGTSGLSELTGAFKEGGITGAMEAFGTILSDGLNMIIGKLPDFIDAGMKLLGAVGQGILDNLPTIVDASVQIAVKLVQGLIQALPELAKGAIKLIESLGQALMDNADSLLEMGSQLLEMLWNGITKGLPVLVSKASEIMGSIGEGLKENLPTLLDQGLNALMEFSGSLRENAGLLVDAGLDMIVSIVEGLIEALPVMIETIPTIVTNIAGIINDNAPKLIATGIELIGKLVIGIVQAIPTIIAEFPKIVQAIFAVITAVNWVNLGKHIITFIGNGIKSLAANLPNALKSIGQNGFNFLKNIDWKNLGSTIIKFIINGIKTLVTEIPNVLKSIGMEALNLFKNIDWLGLGLNIVAGIASGILNGAGLVWDAITGIAQGAWDAITGFFDVESPSKRMMWVGKMVDEGLAKGIEKNAGLVDDAMEDITEIPTVEAKVTGGVGTQNSVTINVYGAQGQDVEELAEIVSRKIDAATNRRMYAMGVTV